MSDAVVTPRLLHLSLVAGSALRDHGGARLGRVDDLIVRLEEAGYPPISGLLASVAGRQTYVPADLIEDITTRGVTLRVPKLDLRPFERRPDEVLLGKDVLDRQLINVDGARLVRANEIELARVGGWWRAVGVDTGPRGAVRRLLPKSLAPKLATSGFLDWASIEPFVGHVPSVRLSVPHPKLARLHPAQLADLVEAASHAEGEEIIDAVKGDHELEAEVFEELDHQHQREFVAERSDEDVAGVLSRMAPDDAADLVADLPDERRDGVLSLLSERQRAKVRALLGYDPATAGGLMSTEFICLYQQSTVGEASERLAVAADDQTSAIFLMDSHKQLTGTVPLGRLFGAAEDTVLLELALPTPSLRADADFEEVARLMADYNLLMAAVTDEHERMIGAITVDDVLEVMLPKGWRRHFGLLGDE
jgi:CBS domain-containing protein